MPKPLPWTEEDLLDLEHLSHRKDGKHLDWTALCERFPNRTRIVLDQLKKDKLYPAIDTAHFNARPGIVPAGYRLELTQTNVGGVLCVTIDGSDPRLIDGIVAPSARIYSEPIVISQSVNVRARVLANGVWSALQEGAFYPAQDFSALIVSEIMYHPAGAAGFDGDEYEFVELKNAGTATLDLAGVSAADSSGLAILLGLKRAARREDPDAILVGEMRDLETIRLALTAAETGHLVFGTLHTSSAAKTIDRIIDVFPADEKEMVRAMLSESLQAVISQTLCKTKDGQGRVAAHEIMLGTSAIRNLIREAKVAQMYSAIQTGNSFGMQTLDQNLTDLVKRNIISPAEARSKAKIPENFPG